MKNGNINEYGPSVSTPALGVVAIAHSSKDDGTLDLTIDMTPSQAIAVGKRLIDLGEWANYDLSMAGDEP